jgi:signal transduction histidine kinase
MPFNWQIFKSYSIGIITGLLSGYFVWLLTKLSPDPLTVSILIFIAVGFYIFFFDLIWRVGNRIKFKGKEEVSKLLEEKKNNSQKIENGIDKEIESNKLSESLNKFEAEYSLKLAEVLSVIILSFGLVTFTYLNSSISSTSIIIYYALTVVVAMTIIFAIGYSVKKYHQLRKEYET